MIIPIIWPPDAGPEEREEIGAVDWRELVRRPVPGAVFSHRGNRWYDPARRCCSNCAIASVTVVISRGSGSPARSCPVCDPLGWARLCIGTAPRILAEDVIANVERYTPAERMAIAARLLQCGGDEAIRAELAVRADEGLVAGRFSEPVKWNRHALKRWLKRDLVALVAGQPVVSLDKKQVCALACNLLVVVESGIDDVAE